MSLLRRRGTGAARQRRVLRAMGDVNAVLTRLAAATVAGSAADPS
jgi:hypothetical protein